MADRDPISTIPAIVPVLDHRFRHLTERGNRALRAGAVGEAETCFRGAAEEADVLFADAAEASAAAILIAPMAVTVAAHNLASLKGLAGEAAEADAILTDAAERLLAAAASAATPLTLRLNCVRHLRHALHLLADLDHARGGKGDGISPLAERTVTVAAEVIRVAEILRQTDAVAARHPARSAFEAPERTSEHGHSGPGRER